MSYVAVIFHGFGSPGFSGEKEVALQAIKALEERGIEFKVVSFSRPRNTNYDVVYVSPFALRRFDKYQRLLTAMKARELRPKLFLNMSGTLVKLSDIAPHVVYMGAFAFATPSKYERSLFWRLYLFPFKKAITSQLEEAKHARVIVNSRYSAKKMAPFLGYEPEVLYPPITNYDLYSRAYHEGERERAVLTIGRFERGKFLENSIEVAKALGVRLYLVGSLTDRKYYKHLQDLARGADVVFVPNAPPEKVAELLSKVSVYFHPTVGEHFGMPVAESMLTGIVPVAPNESRASELAPEFSYSDLEDAKEKVKQTLESPVALRREMRERVKGLRPETFREELFEKLRPYLG